MNIDKNKNTNVKTRPSINKIILDLENSVTPRNIPSYETGSTSYCLE